MKKYNIRTALLTCLAAVMVLGVSANPSLSYFTTYVSAIGGHPISLHRVDTEVDETYNGRKIVAVKNVGDAECWVRVKVLTDDLTGVDITFDPNDWELGAEGYYYYKHILPVGAVTSEINVVMERQTGPRDQYKVIIVQECTPVLYDANGNPYADWSLKAEVT